MIARRRHRPRVAACATTLLVALALAACSGAQAPAAGEARAAAPDGAAEAAPAPRPDLVDPRPLQGAGAVAFDADSSRLAWAAENGGVRILDLERLDGERRLGVEVEVGDVAFAPDGALWLIAAGEPQLWRDGALACRAQDVEADRLLAVDGEGVVVVRYAHGGGVGMIRHQAWLDPQCAQVDARVDPLPEGIEGSDADRGAPLGRDSLQPAHLPPAELDMRLAQVQLPAGAGVEQAVAVSPDGRWWVLAGVQGRTLWRREQP